MKPPDISAMKPGEAGEEWVAYLYRKRGCKILHRNYALYGKKKLGEIDVIAKDGRRLIMVEVRTRRDEQFMKIIETINARKQSYLRRMTALFLQTNPRYDGYEIQIDVAAVLMDPFDTIIKSVNIIENAIEDVA